MPVTTALNRGVVSSRLYVIVSQPRKRREESEYIFILIIIGIVESKNHSA